MASTHRILLWEPHPLLRELLTALLTDDGHTVTACRSLVEVFARCDGDPNAVAMLDLPSSSTAWEHVHHLAAVLPVVLLVDPATEWTPLAQEHGVAAIVPKPFDITAVVQALHDVTTKRSHALVA